MAVRAAPADPADRPGVVRQRAGRDPVRRRADPAHGRHLPAHHPARTRGLSRSPQPPAPDARVDPTLPSPRLSGPSRPGLKGDRVVPYSALRDKKTELIRKARDGSVFIAPTSATAITTLTTGAGGDLTPLPTGY